MDFRPRLRLHHAAIAAVPVAFGLGWACGSPAPGRAVADARVAAAMPAATGATSSSCVDSAAMKANQNLVAQLAEATRERAAAQESAKQSEAKLAVVVSARAIPRSVSTTREEWGRMAKDGKIRLRTPCASWKSARRFGDVSSRSGRHVLATADREVRRRARAAGLEDDELEALEAAYERANARTWQKIHAACEEGPFFQAALEESSTSTDAERVAVCQASLLPDEPETTVALRRMAESRAAGARAPGDARAERIAFALTESLEVLYDEMKSTLGEEKTMRALDLGVLCTHETIYATAAK